MLWTFKTTAVRCIDGIENNQLSDLALLNTPYHTFLNLLEMRKNECHMSIVLQLSHVEYCSLLTLSHEEHIRAHLYIV